MVPLTTVTGINKSQKKKNNGGCDDVIESDEWITVHSLKHMMMMPENRAIRGQGPGK